MQRRASLAPETLLYGSSSGPVASRYRCDELPVDYLLAAVGAFQPAAHHQLHHAHQTTSFKPSYAGPSSSSSVAYNPVPSSSSSTSSVMQTTASAARRRSLPLRTHQKMIVGGQMPAHRRRSGVAPETRLNTAQHPHVASIYDPKIQLDDRVLRNLKDTERESILTGPTFLKSAQSELAPSHRATVVQWMRDVLCEEMSEEEVFPLAVLILDNYLSIENIMLRDVQGIAAACILMASKMKAPTPINAARLSYFTENSVSAMKIVNFELVILRMLKWQIALPTAFDFADQVFCRFPSLRDLKSAFGRALYDLQSNVKDAVCRPSIQAAVAFARAARAVGLPPRQTEELRVALAAHLDFDLDVALRMGSVVATAPVTPQSETSEDVDVVGDSDEDAAFAASSLAYTPVREAEQQAAALLQRSAAAAAAAAAPRIKSPPATPPSGTDSGFSSTQGTPEAADEADSRPLSSPY